MTWLPPLPTLLFAGALAVAGLSAPFLLRSTNVSGDQPIFSTQTSNVHVRTANVIWPGPRPETKREILIAPLFAEDRKLPAPFEASTRLRTNTTPESETPQTIAKATAVAPPAPAPEPVIEEKQEPVVAQPAKPLVSLNLPELRLVGTFIARDRGIARALLVSPQSGSEEIWVDENGQYAGWVLTIVSPEAVRLEAGEESLTLEMWKLD